MRRILVIAACACCGPGSHAPAAPPPPYDGVTRCGPAVPTPTVDPALLGITVHGDLDKSLITRPIRAHRADFAACYERALARDPTVEGTVASRFFITADGSVAEVEIRGFDREVDYCMCQAVLALRFLAPGSAKLFGGVQVNYPFSFRPGAE